MQALLHINEVHVPSWAGQELMANQMDQLYADGGGLTQHSFPNQAPDAAQTRTDELRLEWIHVRRNCKSPHQSTVYAFDLFGFSIFDVI